MINTIAECFKNMEPLNCIQIHSLDKDLYLLGNKIWIKENPMLFSMLKEFKLLKNQIKKEVDENFYSISVIMSIAYDLSYFLI